MNSALNFFKQAVRLGLLEGNRAREAYRASRAEGIEAEAYVRRVGLLSEADIELLRAQLHEQEELPIIPPRRNNAPKVVSGYRVIERIGSGGMGTVYRAEQMAMQRQVALKVLAPQYAKDDNFVGRFMREARAAGQIKNPHVVACYDAGRDGDTLYMALELVGGGDAHQLLEQSGGMIEEIRALEIAADCARGLCAIDLAGLVHRDIKPSNILLDEIGRGMLGDLGLARNMAEDDNISVSGEIFGTPAYMSPEHARGEQDLDIRTDIYSLGASLFTLLTGRQPFVGKSSLDVASKVLSQPVPDPRDYNAQLTKPAAQLVMRCMAKERSLRHQSADDLVRDIESIIATGRPDSPDTERTQTGAVSILWRGASAIMVPGGALGQNDSHQWGEALELVVERSSQAMIIDCASVEWISSEGLALLVRLCTDCQEAQIGFAICNLNESTEKAIRIVQLHRILPLFGTMDEALAAVSGSANKNQQAS